MQTIADQINSLKQAAFIGRQRELAIFEEALENAQHTLGKPWQILNIYGAGGIGKSTLMDAYRQTAEQLNIPFCYLDAQDFAGKPDVFTALLAASLGLSGAQTLDEVIAGLKQRATTAPLVLAIDTFEDIGELNRWLREQFLPQLPATCIVVIAGRFPLAELWKAQPIWHQLINPLPLENFDRNLTQQYLKLNGIENMPLVEAAWLNTDGYPLALSLSVMLAQKMGDDSVIGASDNPNLVTELTQRWLREIPDSKLRAFIEAAAIVRYFNQDLLSHIAGQPLDDQTFHKLVNSSFIRRGLKGWTIHSLVRNALNQELSQRSPERHTQLTLRALNTLAHMALSPTYNRSAALHEFFYLLGDSLVRAALYNEELNPRSELFIEPADNNDAAALEAYMRDWRNERGVLAMTRLELHDRSSNQSIPSEVASEPREPEFIKISEILHLFPGSIRLLKDQSNTIHGLTIVLPINSSSIDYLKQQPVTGHYFHTLNSEELAELNTPADKTHNWFVRLIDTRNPIDRSAHAMLMRDLTSMLIQPARFITTTPLQLYQLLLTRFGFEPSQHEAHHDFGKDRPAPYFELDLRGQRLAQHLERMIKEHMGASSDLPIESLLASVIATTPVTNAQPVKETTESQEDLTISLDGLTSREKEVAMAAAEGLPNCTIAARLDISEVTVKKHMSNIFSKLGVRNRAELIKRFWAN